jgi:hypothetical protein
MGDTPDGRQVSVGLVVEARLKERSIRHRLDAVERRAVEIWDEDDGLILLALDFKITAQRMRADIMFRERSRVIM